MSMILELETHFNVVVSFLAMFGTDGLEMNGMGLNGIESHQLSSFGLLE